MIERQFVEKKLKEFEVQEFIAENLKRVGHSHTTLTRTPMGERIVIHASKPGLVVGRKGQNIKTLTKTLKTRFKLDNPQIEIAEVENGNLNPTILAERIANTLERFGPNRFKGIGHRTIADVMSSGAIGIEVLISGKIPSARARRWRFYQGYLKKSGDLAVTGVLKAYSTAKLKTGTVGIQVRIMPPDLELPDKVELFDEPVMETEGTDEELIADENDDPMTTATADTKSDGKKDTSVPVAKQTAKPAAAKRPATRKKKATPKPASKPTPKAADTNDAAGTATATKAADASSASPGNTTPPGNTTHNDTTTDLTEASDES